MTPPRAAASAGAARQPTVVVPVQEVRDALTHLYDPGHLQTHPLAALIGQPGARSAPLAARSVSTIASTNSPSIDGASPDERAVDRRLGGQA